MDEWGELLLNVFEVEAVAGTAGESFHGRNIEVAWRVDEDDDRGLGGWVSA